LDCLYALVWCICASNIRVFFSGTDNFEAVLGLLQFRCALFSIVICSLNMLTYFFKIIDKNIALFYLVLVFLPKIAITKFLLFAFHYLFRSDEHDTLIFIKFNDIFIILLPSAYPIRIIKINNK